MERPSDPPTSVEDIETFLQATITSITAEDGTKPFVYPHILEWATSKNRANWAATIEEVALYKTINEFYVARKDGKKT